MSQGLGTFSQATARPAGSARAYRIVTAYTDSQGRFIGRSGRRCTLGAAYRSGRRCTLGAAAEGVRWVYERGGLVVPSQRRSLVGEKAKGLADHLASQRCEPGEFGYRAVDPKTRYKGWRASTLRATPTTPALFGKLVKAEEAEGEWDGSAFSKGSPPPMDLSRRDPPRGSGAALGGLSAPRGGRRRRLAARA